MDGGSGGELISRRGSHDLTERQILIGWLSRVVETRRPQTWDLL